MSYFDQDISEYIWNTKYRYQSQDKMYDATVEDTWLRVAHNIAQCEKAAERTHWMRKFYQLLENFKFLPGGRILAGAGTAKNVTLFNCYVMKIKDDSLTAIFDALKEGALTLQQGGGIGYDFSILRPSGYHCKKTDSIASGPVSFMKIWDTMSATMLSSGARRGAMMANLRIDHPDILQFITIKENKEELRHFNLSVIITDEFLQAVAKGQEWPLVFPSKKKANTILRRWSGSAHPISCEIVKIVDAKELWQQIIRSAYSYAEPGVIFEDTINRYNPLWYTEWISATNPCGEIPLPFYGACNLGSINLTRFVKNPFTKQAKMDWQGLEKATEVATRFLDNVIEMSHYPLKAQRTAAYNTRRIGLGFTGLADSLVMLNTHYGSANSLHLTEKIAQTIAFTTWLTSANIAKEKGSFPLLKKEYMTGTFVLSLPNEIQKSMKKCGMRNSHHNAIAPAGSISLLANNISGGLEPIFAKKYVRQVRSLEGQAIKFEIEDYAYHHYKKITKNTTLPPAWKDVNSLTPEEHLAIQSKVQPYVDNAISKTINVPKDFPLTNLMEIYQQAYELGLKGCTIFRPNPVTGSVLSSDEIDPCCTISLLPRRPQ